MHEMYLQLDPKQPMAWGSALYMAEVSHFLCCIFKALQTFYHRVWHMKWISGFAGFVISITARLNKVTSVSPWEDNSDQTHTLVHAISWTNSLEETATGENQKFHLAYSQQSVHTVGCWTVLSRGPWFVCAVLTHGSWPCSEEDHQTDRTFLCLCNHFCVLMGTELTQSTSLSTGTCWLWHVCMSQFHRSHEPTRMEGFWTSLSSLLSLWVLSLHLPFFSLTLRIFHKHIALTSEMFSYMLLPVPSYGNNVICLGKVAPEVHVIGTGSPMAPNHSQTWRD